jgi:TolB-like protein/predicted negative regulator of RcsB-dependent stress response
MSLFAELKRRNVLRVAAAYLVVGWLLTEVLTTILPTLGAPNWVAKAVILSFAFGFIPAVVLSWVYELTPEGIRKENDDDRDAPARVAIGNLDYLTIVGVILATIFIAFISASQSPEKAAPVVAAVSNESVAVLPFVNMSSDEKNEYFSDGLTETLLHMLAQIPDLKVAARTSSFAFKGKNMDIREIAEALQVAHVLEGSVQQAGNRIRITAQLIRASDGYHVWSESFDRNSDDIFGIQDEIASKVGSALSASLLGSGEGAALAGVGTDNPDAYDLYLQALKQRETFSYGGLAASEQLLKGALTIDSNFLDAKTELASNYLHQLETGSMSQDEAFSAVSAITDQVLTADPDNAGARAIHVYMQAAPSTTEVSTMSMDDAISELESLVAANPRELQARLLLSRLLMVTQQSDRALALQLEALETDPYNARIHYEIGTIYLHLDEPEKARAALQTSIDIEPLQPNAYLQLGFLALRSGDGVDYLQQSLKAMEVDSKDHEIPGFIAEFLYPLGLIEEADDFRNRVMAIAPTSAIAYRIELLRNISLGDADGSLAAARKAIEDGVEDRQFAFGGAVQHILRSAIQSGTIQAESEYLEQHVPGILDVDAEAVPARFLYAQRLALDAWYVNLESDELLRRIKRIQEITASYGFDLLQNPGTRVNIMVLQDNTADAIELALSDVFTRSVLTDQNWRARLSQSQYTDFVADPRVQAAMQNWEAEEVVIRDRIKSYLLDLSSAS